jgi:aminopeptidase N
VIRAPRLLLTFLVLRFGLGPFLTHADSAGGEATRRGLTTQAVAQPSDLSKDRRRYPPDREVLVRHLALDITPDFKRRTISGEVNIRFQPNLKPVTQVTLDAVDLAIQSVKSGETIQAWQAADGKLVVTFSQPIPPDREANLVVTYSAEPTKGIYFRTPEMGYKEGDTHLFSQGEAEDSRYWYPMIDAPNAKFSTELTCRVPDGMTVISNGRLVSQDKDPASGWTRFHWTQEKPHANYLVTLVAGYFKKLEDRHRDVPLAFWTPPSEINAAGTSFQDTREIMDFLEKETGTPYPWDKYDQICVNDFVEGGMENTSATTLTDDTLFTAETENIHDSGSLVSHEMAHQWFGDLVTSKDWSDIWLNEGFATYYEVLYGGHKHGRDSMLYELYHNARGILAEANDTNAIVRRNYGDPMSVFNYLAYPKGGWVLHMLRSQLGEDLYRRCIQTYLARHAYKNVQTEDLRAVIHELSGRSFESFFDQWLYHAHHPELDITYGWDEAMHLARVTVRQDQALSSQVLLFDFPLTVRFQGPFGTVDRVVQVKEKESDFYFPLTAAALSVRIDPEYTLLAKIHFDVSREMIQVQLANTNDVMGRLLAVEKLATEQDHEAVTLLGKALRQDPFHGVRIEAAAALRTIHTDEALDALLASTRQTDARVRQAVVAHLGEFYRESIPSVLIQILANEKNPEVVASALRGLAPYPNAEVREILLKHLETDSFRDRLSGAAIHAMKAQDDPSYIGPLLHRLQGVGRGWTSHTLAQGIDAVAYLARNETQRDAVREFLVRHVNDKRERVKLAALTALGTLGDSKALAVLETFAKAAKESPERTRAEKAITALRSARKPVDDFKELREEVVTLQKESRDLRKELDDLKNQVRSREAAGEKKGSKPAKGK